MRTETTCNYEKRFLAFYLFNPNPEKLRNEDLEILLDYTWHMLPFFLVKKKKLHTEKIKNLFILIEIIFCKNIYNYEYKIIR